MWGKCESVVHVLWECPLYFMGELDSLLGGGEEFSTLDI